MREIVFDTETTGLDPKGGDRLTELGCVEVVDFLPTGRTWHTLIDPERDIPLEVTKITGHTRELLHGEPKFAEIVDDFLTFVGDDRIVAHNARFDQGFINAELARAGRTPFADERFYDTLE
ncbi:MAG: DNA polymerase III subunit epsilon, partial [Caulobacterales bacterium]|nr:DNA polymerase III subunit epsilon [Caulobacterales bacterium]